MIKPTAIRLGYAVGSGDPVDIPLKHLVITGQTQEAGKTTALEALISRWGLRAVTFITKRGEGSFTGARRIAPYFREQADWQFVASILEASRGEKLKFERAWIIRASKGARTLADVQRNVRKAMETAKGMSADVYLTLDAYLEAVVPQIAAVRWAPSLELAAGVNAVDLTGLNVEMQHLVIRSTLDWVLERESDTVIVIPEAWNFVPQGRGTPVKLAAERFIRQGASLRNFLWLDSQDIAGVEKIILKSCPLWILGVQREANEIKRTLDNIPAGVSKPRATDVATLELGQFYACWKSHAVKTYVQPAWMAERTAVDVARGRLPLDHTRGSVPRRPMEEAAVTKDEAARLTRENEALKTELAALRRKLEKRELLSTLDSAYHLPVTSPPSREDNALRDDVRKQEAPARTPRPYTPQESFDNEALYHAFKARLLSEAATDPAVLKVLTQRPELIVQVERVTVTADGSTTKGRLARLIVDRFFDETRRFTEALKELERTGTRVNNKTMSIALKELVVGGFLTNEGDGYRLAPGAKVRVVEA